MARTFFAGLAPFPSRVALVVMRSMEFFLPNEWHRWFIDLVNYVNRVQTFTEVLSPASVAANTTAEQTFTVVGLTTGMVVTVNKPSAQAGLGIVGCRVSALDTLAITFGNWTGSPIVPTAAETYDILAVKK